MSSFSKYKTTALAFLIAGLTGCGIPKIAQRGENRGVPAAYGGAADSTNMTAGGWRQFFTDPALAALIDTALQRNQELQITLREIEIARSEVRIRKGAILPTAGLRAGAGVSKLSRYTAEGAGEAATEIVPGRATPEPLGDFGGGLYASWEADIWKKLRTAKKAALNRYLASVEGKNFVMTNLVSEVANSYFELIALDNQLDIVRQNVALQRNALEIVKTQKDAARTTELAVQKFVAEVRKTESLEYDLSQQVTEVENRINLLLGRFPQPIRRDKTGMLDLLPVVVHTGLPSELLLNRPDIRQAEALLSAAKLDVAVARKEFYPSVGITANFGVQSFSPGYLARLPESIIVGLAGDLVAPLINRNAIKAEFAIANARQQQAVYSYERTVVNAYLEVATQLSRISNLEKSYDLKQKQVEALTRSIEISNDLFKSARADYLEVLMTQRDALESKLELVETKKNALNAVVDVYRDLGGGWK